MKNYFNIVATGPYINTKTGSKHVKRGEEIITTRKNNYIIEIARKLHVQRFLSEIGFSIMEKQLGLK